MLLKKIKSNLYIWTLVLFLLMWFTQSNGTILAFFELHRNICYVCLLVAYLILLIYQYQKKQAIEDYLWLIGGFLFQFIYVTATTYTVSTHDMGSFQGFGSSEIGVGHLGYIGYIFNHGQLPDINPMWVWGYYNPPLHYVLAALWLRINAWIGLPETVCLENLQLLTLLYTMLSLCVAYTILEELKITEKVRKIWIVFLSFFPFFFYIAGALGNDTLAMLLSFVAIFYTIKWYKNNSLKNIIILAFAIGFGMMTKLNVGLIAPATAFVFLVVLWKRRNEWEKLLVQFVMFGVTCVPLGLWWSIRCFILYEMPIGYVQPILASPIDVSGYSLYERFFSSKEIWMNPFMDYNQYSIEYDYGIFSTLIKSGLFCDYPFFTLNDWEYQLCRLNVFLALFLLLFIVAIFIWKLYEHIRYKMWGDTVFWFASIALVVQIGMFISFVFKFPNVCSADFRYIVPCLMYFMIITDQGKERSQNENVVKVKSWIVEKSELLIGLFTSITVVIYTIFLLGLHG